MAIFSWLVVTLPFLGRAQELLNCDSSMKTVCPSATYDFTPSTSFVAKVTACGVIDRFDITMKNTLMGDIPILCSDAGVSCDAPGGCSAFEWTTAAGGTYEIVVEEPPSFDPTMPCMGAGVELTGCPTQTTSTQTTSTDTTSTATTSTATTSTDTTSTGTSTSTSTSTGTSRTGTTSTSTGTSTATTTCTTRTGTTSTSTDTSTGTSTATTSTGTTSTGTTRTGTSSSTHTFTTTRTSADGGSTASIEVGGCMTLSFSGSNLRALIAAYRQAVAKAANVDPALVEVIATRGSICARLQERRLQENLNEQVAMVFVIRFPPSMEEAANVTRNVLDTIPTAEVARLLAEEVNQVEGLGQVTVSSDLLSGSVQTVPVNEGDTTDGEGSTLLIAIVAGVLGLLALCALGVGIYLCKKKEKVSVVSPYQEPQAAARAGALRETADAKGDMGHINA